MVRCNAAGCSALGINAVEGGWWFCEEHTPNLDRTMKQSEAVSHPAHYGGADNPYEAIKVIEAWGLDFCLGNAVKYISRAGKKADPVLQDLKKARWYLDRQIKKLEERKL
jgi:hypothetical protein